MSYEPKENKGNLFKNDKKEGNQPDYRGDCNVNGVKMEMAAWIKKSETTGATFMSFKFQQPYVKPDGQVPATVANEFPDANFEDDIPF